MMFLQEIHYILGSPLFILIAILISLTVKIYLLRLLIPKTFHTMPLNKTLLFLLGTLIGSLFGDVAWILKLMRQLVFPDMPYTFYIFFVRISWAFLILQYQSLALFIESLSAKKFTLNLYHKIFSSISCLWSCYFLF